MKKAFITGVTGQDGSYLAELLLEKDYEVHAIVRRNSDFTTKRIDHIFHNKKFITYHGDLIDSSNLFGLLKKIKPDEVYNLGAQSHVGISFEIPEYSSNVDGIGTLRLLTAIKDLGLDCRFYQASTSEMFGGLKGSVPQSEKTAFTPKSPYATAKLYAHWISVNFRESYGMHINNGILFNHESPRRGKTFVTKKITRAVAQIQKDPNYVLRLGNLDARRDWGYAKEYVEFMWKMLQQDKPDDYVIGTGTDYSVRQFVEKAFSLVNTTIEWSGQGLQEKGRCKKTGRILIEIDPFYYRPSEVEHLRADPSKAREKLGWNPKMSFDKLVEMMQNYDLKYDDYGYPDE